MKPNSPKIIKLTLLTALLTLVFVFIAHSVYTNEVIIFDDTLTSLIRQYTNHTMTTFMKGITFWGNTNTFLLVVIIISAALALLKNPLSKQKFFIGSSIGGWFLTEFLKWFFHRPRPDENPLIPATGYSFPSGHALVSIVIYGAIAYLLSTNLPPSLWRKIVTAGLSIFIFLIGISRIYLGVHYPSDVFGGFAVGGAWLITCIIIKHCKNAS